SEVYKSAGLDRAFTASMSGMATLSAAIENLSIKHYADLVNGALRDSGAYPRVAPRCLADAMVVFMTNEVSLPEVISGTSFVPAPANTEKERAAFAIQLWVTTLIALKMAQMAISEPEQLQLLFSFLAGAGLLGSTWLWSGRGVRAWLHEWQDRSYG
ncbi:MAG: hypothetical protein L0H79_15845, partial [Intrasporangium sp.]|uniref:hypothetical protein n=1 Tax=Intrasporangium sp. TaxID=1925024 RepID=UPI002647DD80